jgi:excisionase family DNA binding protein
MDKKVYRIKEAAEQLGVSERTCWRLIADGKLKSQELPGCSVKVVTNKSLDNFIAGKATK